MSSSGSIHETIEDILGRPSRITDRIRTEPALTGNQKSREYAVSTDSDGFQKASFYRPYSHMFDSGQGHRAT